MDNLSKLWHNSKPEISNKRFESDEVIRAAKSREKSIMLFHLGNLFILVPTLILLCYYFFYYIQLQHWLSKTGSYLMLLGLFVRITLEILSYLKFKKINYFNSAVKASDDTYVFYSFRKKIHGPVTIVIIILYVLGVGLLTREVALYIPMKWLIVMHSLFVVSGCFIIWKVRQGIKGEMDNLRQLIDIKKQMQE